MIVLLITNIKGGTGKTTVAFNLLVELAKNDTDDIHQISNLRELKKIKLKKQKDEIIIIDASGSYYEDIKDSIIQPELIIAPLKGSLEMSFKTYHIERSRYFKVLKSALISFLNEVLENSKEIQNEK